MAGSSPKKKKKSVSVAQARKLHVASVKSMFRAEQQNNAAIEREYVGPREKRRQFMTMKFHKLSMAEKNRMARHGMLHDLPQSKPKKKKAPLRGSGASRSTGTGSRPKLKGARLVTAPSGGRRSGR
jgi:hypothetical protein